MKSSYYFIAGSLMLLSLVSFQMLSFDLTPRTIEVSGIISDTSGSPFIGATILEKGTKNRTSSGLNGSFTLLVASKSSEIEVSYPGYTNQSIKISELHSSTKLQIKLTVEEMPLEEVVVSSNAVQGKVGALKRLEKDRAHITGAPKSGIYELTKDDEMNNYSQIHENKFKNAKMEPLSTLSIDVDRAAYSNVRRMLQDGSLPPPDAVRIEEMINYFDYNYKAPTFQSKHPFNSASKLINCPWNDEHQLLHVSLQGAKIEREAIPPANFVFLIDVSGSMNSYDKLPLLKSSLKLLINQLNNEDRIAIVVYAGAAGCVLESTSGSDRIKILSALDNLKAGGSTAGAAGIQQAYKIAANNFIQGGNNRIILATDGDFNVGPQTDDALVHLIEEKRKTGIYLSVFGFGRGNYKDGKMQKIANAGNGNHSYIDNMKEAKKLLMDEFGATLYTIAKDVKIQIEFNPAVVKSYRLVGYENRILAAEDFNDDSKDAGEMGAGHSVTVLYEIIPIGSTSKFSNTIDPLKYQKINNPSISLNGNEFATIKYRYKKPQGGSSIKYEEIIKNDLHDWHQLPDNIKWAANVAEFGLLLRKSEFANKANYDQLINRIQVDLKTSSDKHKFELLDLVEIAKSLDQSHFSSIAK